MIVATRVTQRAHSHFATTIDIDSSRRGTSLAHKLSSINSVAIILIGSNIMLYHQFTKVRQLTKTSLVDKNLNEPYSVELHLLGQKHVIKNMKVHGITANDNAEKDTSTKRDGCHINLVTNNIGAPNPP
ncbi:hypothetical protein B5X24_HaOG208662 [Helicoverpa armigera]|uniref:Uncharacterized protein n=1 Tax=Helicoverpa armigera TaxID=29058 RepID=A0A2W1BI17_HELAM|nr:hypothetical protein B5X24_HaOG208662 [Helicoverpa armigera]